MGGNTMKVNWSKYVCFADIKNNQNEDNDAIILFNSLSRSTYMIGKDVKNDVDNFISTGFCEKEDIKDVISKLYYDEIIVNSQDNETIKLDAIRNKRHTGNELGVFYFVPTYNCNFKCPYCITPETVHNCENTSGFMTDELIAATARFIVDFAQKKELKKVEIELFGGEPMIGIKQNIRLMEEIKRLKPKTLEVEYHMISNGFIVDSVLVEKIKEFGFKKVQITLDGPQEIHDKRRICADNTKTFDVIMKNIEVYLKLGIQVTIRVNIDRENGPHILELVKVLVENNLNDKVALGLAPVDPWAQGEVGGHTKEVAGWFGDVYKYAKDNGFTLVMWETFCGIYGQNFFVISPEGYLYKCPSFVGVKGEEVGHVTESEFYPLYNNITQMDISKRCKDCDWVGVCGGGCYFVKKRVMKDEKYCAKGVIKTIGNSYLVGTYSSQKVLDRHLKR